MSKDSNIQKVKKAAKDATFTPAMAKKIRDFFLQKTTKQDHDEIDDWMHYSPANDHLFDVLCEVRGDGDCTPYTNLLIKMAKIRDNPFYKYRQAILTGLFGLLVLLILDYIIPAHPLSSLVYGANPAERTLDQTTITTDNESRTIWLSDSTKVELQPHSMARYPNELSWTNRMLKVIGSATVTVRGSFDEPFRLVAGEYKFETYKNVVIRYENDKLTVEALHP